MSFEKKLALSFDKEQLVCAIGRVVILKQEMEKSAEFDSEGAGENYKAGFLDATNACLGYLLEARTDA